jgi:hypothetical protein
MAKRRDDQSRDPPAEDPLLGDDPMGPDVDTGVTEPVDPEAATAGDSVRARLATPFSELFSLRLFLVVLALATVGLVLGTVVVGLPGAGIAGIAVVGFAVGVGHGHRRYLELLLAGLLVAGIGTVFEYALVAVVGGVAPVALGAAAGGIAALAGHYFGRDLRAGLTRDL